jgi:hypothetical protein
MSPRPPVSRRLLDIAIDKFADSHTDDPLRVRRMMGATIVAQMLPDGVVKGGGALKLRFGDRATRYTRDLDAAYSLEPQDFIDQLEAALKMGWCGFTGRVVPRKQARIPSLPPEYVMKPFDVKLDYLGRPWQTVPLELGHNEIGAADEADMGLASDIPPVFEALGFPAPKAVRLMSLSYQIAQKLHAVSSPRNERVRDLVDLQIIFENAEIDLVKTKSICKRLFSYRKQHAWPPTITVQERWESLYADAMENLPVFPTVDEAIVWANDLIARIDAAK